MPCAEMKELEATWKRHLEATTYRECSQATDLSMAKTQKLLLRECHADQARAAYLMLTHRRNCSVCGEKKPVKVSG